MLNVNNDSVKNYKDMVSRMDSVTDKLLDQSTDIGDKSIATVRENRELLTSQLEAFERTTGEYLTKMESINKSIYNTMNDFSKYFQLQRLVDTLNVQAKKSQPQPTRKDAEK
jgi:hypothetical protein